MGAEQSNSSLVLDERYALKLYRRIAPGMNPSSRCSASSPSAASSTRRARGLRGLRGPSPRGDAGDRAAVRVRQGRRLGADAQHARARRARLAAGARAAPRRGDGVAAQRPASDPSDPRARGSEQRGARAPVRLDRRGDRARLHLLPDIPALEQVEAVARRCATTSPAHEHRQRRPRDPDARRLSPRPGALDRRGRLAGPRLRGRAARSVPNGAEASPLRDVAGMLRSFAYAASAAKIRRNVDPPEGWEDRCRSAFLDGYLETADPSCCRRAATRSSDC